MTDRETKETSGLNAETEKQTDLQKAELDVANKARAVVSTATLECDDALDRQAKGHRFALALIDFDKSVKQFRLEARKAAKA